MPTRNSRKQYRSEAYYHLYTRGINKEQLFKSSADYSFFMSLFKRYLSEEKSKTSSRQVYPNFHKDLELNAFCLMRNHIHLLVYQKNSIEAISKFMQSVMTSYSMYFNQKYNHFGPVFQGRYLASHIDHEMYLEHITRYIHLNPKNYLNYEYSSLQYYLGSKSATWLTEGQIMQIFNNDSNEYINFLSDYEGHMAMLEEIKYELADK